jgi:hypothetical protein
MPQLRRIEGRSPSFALAGPDTTPTGPAWEAARPAARRAYGPILAAELARVKQGELAAGLDHAGRRLKAIRPRTWEQRARIYRFSPGGWQGPPLMPQSEYSRTRRLLRVRAAGALVVGDWPRWGRILGYHARGEVKGAPVRDVVGVSARGRRAAIRLAADRWHREVGNWPDPIVTGVAPPAARPPAAGAPSARPVAGRARIEVADLVARYPQLAELGPRSAWDAPPAPAPAAAPRPGPLGRLARAIGRLLGR